MSGRELTFQTQITQGTNRQQYDVGRDGRFLITTDLADTSCALSCALLNGPDMGLRSSKASADLLPCTLVVYKFEFTR